jgi:hypothetical protein
MNMPPLWWSKSLGLVTCDQTPDAPAYWHIDNHRTSLRHEGLPNELPEDAVPLIALAGDEPYELPTRYATINKMVKERWLRGNHFAYRIYLQDALYRAQLKINVDSLSAVDQAMANIGYDETARDEVLRLALNGSGTGKPLTPPDIQAARTRLDALSRGNPMKPGPCVWSHGRDAVIGESCSACGHTNLVHPGPNNPSLTACVICQLLLDPTRGEV